nr:hypothetical protein Hi04_10k_c3883_00022 [uncultured bacterium]
MKRVAALRWLVVVPLLVGPLLTLDRTQQVIGYSLADAAALAFLLTRLDFHWAKTLWAWTVVFVFVQGYFIATYAAATIVSSRAFEERFGYECNWVSDRTIVNAIPWFSASFIVFCVVAWLLLGRTTAGDLPNQRELVADARRVTSLAIAAAITCIVAGILQAYLGIGVMGRVSAALPFHFDTIIINTRLRIGPAILLLTAWLYDVHQKRRHMSVIVGLLVVLALMDALIRTSRGSLPFYMLPVFCLWVMTKRFSARRLALAVVVVAATVALHPVVSAMRMDRMVNDESATEALNNALLDTGSSVLESAPESAGNLGKRVTGVDGVWFSERALPAGFAPQRLLDLGEYYTRNVVGLDLEGDFRAPGFVGAFMLLGGFPAVIICTALYIVFLWAVWRWAGNLQTGVVARAWLVSSLIFLVSENPIYPQYVVGTLLTIAGMELVYRRFLVTASPPIVPVEFAGPNPTRLPNVGGPK